MAHNDHLKQPSIERTRGVAKGTYYKGIAMTSRDFIIIAPTIEILRDTWATVSTAPIREEDCVLVAMFAQRDTKDLNGSVE